jgi:hypothetical protein
MICFAISAGFSRWMQCPQASMSTSLQQICILVQKLRAVDEWEGSRDADLLREDFRVNLKRRHLHCGRSSEKRSAYLLSKISSLVPHKTNVSCVSCLMSLLTAYPPLRIKAMLALVQSAMQDYFSWHLKL